MQNNTQESSYNLSLRRMNVLLHFRNSNLEHYDEVINVSAPAAPDREQDTRPPPLTGRTCQAVARGQGCRHVWPVLGATRRQCHQAIIIVQH